MSRPRRNPPNVGQIDLFAQSAVPDIPNAPDLDIYAELRGACAAALKHARSRGLSRERVVERMNLCLPDAKPITLRQLNAWMADSKEFSEWPYRYIAAFAWACQCDAPLAVAPNAMGYDLVDRRDAAALELGRLNLNKAELQKRERELKRQIGDAD